MAFLESISHINDDPALRSAYDCIREGNCKLAFSYFSESDSPEAVFCLGFMYLNGKGTKKDAKKAFSLFCDSMDKGYVPAISEVAQCYGYGIGVGVDDAKAFGLFSKAAEEGDPYGMSMLSMMYRNGDGVKRDNKKADEWSEKAESAGEMDDYEDPGLRYLSEGNVLLGRSYLMRSAVMGSPVSAMALSFVYSFGVFVREDDDEAEDWKETADANGWDEVERDDLKGYDEWFSQFMEVNDLGQSDD